MTPDYALLAVGFWTAANMIVLLWLAVSIGLLRGKLKISIGDGGNPHMIRAMRAQANFTENVPMTLVMLLMAALLGAPGWLVHVFGLALTLGRVFHGMHFLAEDAPGWQRSAGAGITMLVQLGLAIGVLGHALIQMLGAGA